MQIIKWDGQPISKPGWYSDIPIERYHSANMCIGPAVSSSNLRKVWSHSEAHMNAEWAENPDREVKDPTRSMILGQAAHTLFLGDDDYNTRYVVQPEVYPDAKTGEKKPWNYNANYCKDWRAKWESLGRVLLTAKEAKAIKGMAASLTTNGLVQNGMLNGKVECSGFYIDRATGLWIKVRPDVIPTDSGDFTDLKTASEVTTVALMSSIRTYGYNMQGGLISQACDELGLPFKSFNLLFVETAAPYCARGNPLNDKDLGLGRQQNEWALKKIKRAMDTGRFPGPGEDDQSELGLSGDERGRIEARLKLEGLQ